MSSQTLSAARDREAERLHALRQLDLLDTPPSEAFDRISRMASRIFDLPIAAVSLTDSDRQWFKSRVGVEHWSLPRHQAPCAAVAESGEPVVIPDLLADALYRDSPLARSGVRFYAGAPLLTDQGFGLGAMCVLGTEPRQATDDELRSLTDLASMVMAQIELQHAMGHIDPVTGLPNRLQFIDDMTDLTRDRPVDEVRYLVLVDLATIDQLDQAARVLGPAQVDELMREASLRMQTAVGPNRKVYHVAATQMAFLSPPGVPEDAYLDLLGRMLGQQQIDVDARFTTTIAIGVVPFTFTTQVTERLLREAFSAAQDARALPTRVSLYSSEIDGRHKRRFALLNDFGRALLAPDQLRLVFQPRIDVRSRRCVGVEALLRWQHPLLGEIGPAEFIPLVERTPLARQTTNWVLEAAIAQTAQWRAAGILLKTSVNVSAANLDEDDFADRLATRLHSHCLPAGYIELEITESAMMGDSAKALDLLHRIAATGVDLAIDDFGTGYSSLSYLQQLPARILKIDGSFMHGLDTDPRKLSLVTTMIDLAHNFDYRVVGEGVETADVVRLLKRAGCDEIQGYFFGRPMAAANFDRWLMQHEPNPLGELERRIAQRRH